MELNNRTRKLLIGLVAAASVLVARLFFVQVIEDKFKRSAENNSMVYDVIYPSRGIIYDRNGTILVGNKVTYDIMVTPVDVRTFDTLALAQALGITDSLVRAKMAEYRRFRTRIGYRTVPFMKQVEPEIYHRFAEIGYMFPGFHGQVRSTRDYPVNAGGNLLGYVSEVDAAYIRRHEGEYKSGDYAGRTGIEAAREKELRGEKGYRIYLRDSRNRIKASYRDGELDKDAVPGSDIVTTIDASLQQYGQELMRNKVGSLVAIEPSTGEILAMVSSPGIDVDKLANIGQYYSDIVNDPYKPMFNRAVQASYPPGSVFKLVNGLVGLQEGVLRPSDRYPCYQGFYYGRNTKLGCHVHRSPLNLDEAIMMSCNAYFCYVFRNILENRKYGSTEEAFRAWEEYIHSFGLGQKLDSDFPSELGGNVPTADYYNRIYGRGSWKYQTIISLSIGQGEMGITPLQIANICATVANRGYYYIPHIIKDSENVRIEDKYREKHYTRVDTTQFAKVIDGMWRAVNSGYGSGGTASAAAVPGLDICGKTGTAQNPHGKDNSVFICFAPKDNPRIAVAAYVENAGFGGTWACPLASLLVEHYLNGSISADRKYLETRMMEADLMPRLND